MDDDLAVALRAWRERLTPAAAGLATQPGRRATGLRREEIATEAGLSVNYLVELEQGRARAPSPSVVAALAGALRLDGPEREQLHRLAGLSAPAPVDRRLTPAAERALARFHDVPAGIFDPAWTYVAANRLAEAYLGTPVIGENAARRQFLGPRWLRHAPEEEEAFEHDVVGDLHRQLARHPTDADLRALVNDLRAGSERFAALWARRPVAARVSTHKTARHPVIGTVRVHCDVLEITGTDLRLVFWSAPPDTPDAHALARLQ